ncbi:LysR family transcriptional regulator [Trinickia sp.]|uniref:LysR family transcriptional regulator n=1 Tax=Trinickia sp. TaxID=2571163 RepID=UPI003F7D3EDA
MKELTFDLHALEAFVAACESGSMIDAARKLNRTQSAISQQVKNLETQNGIQLFDRDFRPSRPTAAGRLLLELAKDLLEHAHSVSERLLDVSQSDHAQIRLGAVDSFAATVGPALVRAISETAGQVALWSGLTPTLSEQLQKRDLDLAICTESPIPNPRIEQRLLFSEMFLAVVPESLQPTPKSHTDGFGGLSLLRYSRRSVIGQQVDRYLRHIGLEAPRRMEFDASDPLLDLVASGAGYAVTTPLCLWQSRHCLPHVQIVPLPISPLGRRNFYLLFRAGEWPQLMDEVCNVTQQVLEQQILPGIRAALPAVPPTAIESKL